MNEPLPKEHEVEDLQEWMQIYRRARRGELAGLHGRVGENGHLYVDLYPSSETKRFPQKENTRSNL